MKNYDMIHLIQDAGLPKDVQKAVVRAFNKLNDAKEPDGCLSTSVALCLALEYLGYASKLIIGKFWVNDHDFYHAWTELDGRIIDVAIYGNSVFSRFWLDGIIAPQVNKTYAETDVKYEPFAFDEDFQNSLISRAKGISFYSYCDNAPKKNAMWNLVLYYLDSASFSALSKIKEISKAHIIGE